MKLEAATFVRLRRLAPVLDDVLNAGEVEHADQAVDLVSLARLCSQLFDSYYYQHPGASTPWSRSNTRPPDWLAASGIAGTIEGPIDLTSEHERTAMRTRRLSKTLVKDKTAVDMFFVNGIRLRGQLAGFEQFAVLLESGPGVQLVFNPQSGSPNNPRSTIIFSLGRERRRYASVKSANSSSMVESGQTLAAQFTYLTADCSCPVARRSGYALPKPVTYDEKRSGSKVKD